MPDGVMVDWFTGVLSVPHRRLQAGCVVCFRPDESIEWASEPRISVRGSYDNAVQVRSLDENSLWVSGNPAKFFQGHNVFGAGNLRTLVPAFFMGLAAGLERQFPGTFPLDVREFGVRKLLDGVYKVEQVHLTSSYDFGCESRALAVLSAVGEVGRFKQQQVPVLRTGSVTWGEGSRRVLTKLYAKGLEMRRRGKHGLPKGFDSEGGRILQEWASRLLRFEVELKPMFLKQRGLEAGRSWGYDTGSVLLGERFEALQLPESIPLPRDESPEVKDWPGRLRLAYEAWLDGKDLAAMVPRRTFYRYRAEVLALTSGRVDLSVRVREPRESNVVPMWHRVEMVPVGIPDWAFARGLVFDPGVYLRNRAEIS